MQKTRTALTPALIIIVGFLTVCPVFMLILGSFSEGLGAFGSLTLSKYVKAYTDPAFADILVNTVIFTIGSAVVATVLALFLAYLNTRTNIPFKFLFRIISLIPMMVPHILFAVSWVLLLNPSNGMINLFLRQVFGLEGAALNIYTLQGMILVEGLLDLPIAYLVIAPAMSAFDVSLEESSRVCGASNLRTLFRVTLPVLRPAILAAMTLVIVRSLASFAVPSVIGMPGRIYVLATHIYRIVATGYATDYGLAAAVGMSALAASITLIFLYRHLTREGEKYVTISSRGYRPTVIDLKGARYPLFGIVALLSFVLIVLPVAVLFYTSLVPYSMVPSAKAFAMMSWKHWIAVLKDPISLLSLKNSLYLGVGGATLGIILSFFVAYVIVKIRSNGLRLSRIPELSLLLLSGDCRRYRFHVVLRPDAPVRHDLGFAHRLHRHVPALRDPAAHQRLRPDPQQPGRIVPGLRRRAPLHHAADRHSPADPGDRFRVDPDGHDVRQGTEPLRRPLPAGDGGPCRPDPPVRRRRPVGKTLRPGDPDDLHLHDTGDHRLPDRDEAYEGKH